MLLSAEFEPGYPLGFGFSLTAVGGLAGINRTVRTDALQAMVRRGAADHILFPADPIGDAPAILSDLETIFPAADGRYLFGPVARIVWGRAI